MDVEIKIDSVLERIKVIIFAPKMTEEVKALAERLDGTDSDLITGFKDDQVKILEYESITRIYSSSQKVYAVCKSGTYIIKKRLYSLESILKPHHFIRISNSEIINLKKVRSFDLSLSGTICVIFNDGTNTYVSRRYVPKIKEALGI